MSVEDRAEGPEEAASARRVQLPVRFDPRLREALERAADEADPLGVGRGVVSGLVRQAVSDWIADEDREYPISSDRLTGGHVNVRFDAADLAAVDRICDEVEVDRSAAIRCAVRVWLNARAGGVG